MAGMIGFMATWTTYGTWLQGDKRGYVKHGKILNEDKFLQEKCKEMIKSEEIKLTKRQQLAVKDAIIEKANGMGQRLYSVAVCSNHVHLILENTKKPIGMAVSQYKNAARIALRETGVNSKLWTRGFDKRYCFNEAELRNKIRYVEKHNQQK